MGARSLIRSAGDCRLLICLFLFAAPTSVVSGADDAKPRIAGATKNDAAKIEDAKKKAEQVRKQQLVAIEAQYKLMGKMLLASELSFIRATCDVPVELRPRIKGAGEKSVDQSIKRLPAMHVRPAPQGIYPSPEKSLREDLQAELKEVLPPAEYAKFESESTNRKESIKHATVDLVVNRIDQHLWLSAKQRTAITESLTSHWQESNESWISIVNYNNRSLPAIPDNVLVPHLTPRQKSTWNKTQKISTSPTIFLNRSWGGAVEDSKDDYWGTDEKKSPTNEKNDAKPMGYRMSPNGGTFA